MIEFSAPNLNPGELDPAEVSRELAARAETLFAMGPTFDVADTTDSGVTQEIVHLVAPCTEEQERAVPFSDIRAATRTVTRLHAMALRRTSMDGNAPTYELTSVDPEHWGTTADPWAGDRDCWSTDTHPVQKGRGVNAAGPTQFTRQLRTDDLLRLLSTLQDSTSWDVERQTVLRTTGGDRLVSRRALVGLRRAIALTHELVFTRWAERD